MTNNSAMTRLFFAMPAEGLREALRPVHEELARFRRAVKAVEPDNYHITLQFLGDTGQDTFSRLCDDFRALDPDLPALPFTLRGLGAFPDIRRAGVLWCGLDLDMAVMERARALIEALSEKHGFKKESRPFQPHLTLGRVRKEMNLPPECADYIAAHKNTVFGASRFDRIVLFKSELRPEGPLYTMIEEKLLR
jgi:RNA 2',3'-cyclic 3'-phosphodiesterase